MADVSSRLPWSVLEVTLQTSFVFAALFFSANALAAGAPAALAPVSPPQEAPPEKPPILLPAPATASGFRIGPGDVLQVDVWQEPAISGRFTVGANGGIEHPLLGAFSVKGKTADEAAAALRTALADGYLREPRLTVAIAEHKSFQVSIVGGVRQPGVHQLHERSDLFSLVLLAGGFQSGLPGNATVLRARADRAQPDVIAADLAAFVRSGDPAHNPALQPGDLVFVDGSESVVVTPKTGVTVVGEVKTPGVYEAGSLLGVILRAGGPTDFASRNGTRIYRENAAPVDVRLSDLLDRGDRKQDVVLEPGDLVVVPSRLF